MDALRIDRAIAAAQIETARTLFQEYAASLGVDLSFQNFAGELAGLPGDYAPPHGCMLIASWDGHTAGCVAMRKLAHTVCEMKRLFVRTEFLGKGIGRGLALAIVDEARAAGYERMRLDTLPTMQAAQALYGSLGFREIPAYCHNPVPGTKFMELKL